MTAAAPVQSDVPPVVELRGMCKAYPGVRAVDAADLALSAGEVVGLVGKNGAGKSTLIKMMAGLVRADAGEVLADGHPATLATTVDAGRLGLAFVHQELSLIPDLTVAENVFLGTGYPRRAVAFVDWTALRRKTREVLARLGSGLDPGATTGSLSVASQRLVMIARALAQQARVVVLDEPTASLTEQETKHLFAVIAGLKRDGVAVLYVSHRLEEIIELTDRTVVMRDGRVVDVRATATHTRASLVETITGEAGADEESTVHVARHGGADGRVVLEVRGLSRAGVLHDVSFDVRAGEILGIAGLVGAGRTELAQTLFGIAKASGGTVTLGGRRLAITSPAAAIEAGIVLLPEDRKRQGNVVGMDIAANISMPNLATLRRWRRVPLLSPRRESDAARSEMARLKVAAPGPGVLVSQLSGGNQQKVMLGKWLLRGAEVFIFDEPTHGIDVNGRRDVYDVMGRLAAQGKAVIFISSDFAELAGAVDRAVVLVEGRLRGELTGEALTERGILEHCYAYAQDASA